MAAIATFTNSRQTSKLRAMNATQRLTIRQLASKKPLVCLTASDVAIARLADEVAELLLVGDSLGMVIYGYQTTLSVTLQMMITHAQAVVSASRRAVVAVDMPFASYQKSPEQAYKNAAAVLAKSGAQAVKLEGGTVMAPTIEFLTARDIPTIAHIGVTPQSINALGDYRRLGDNRDQQERLRKDAKAVAAAGAFAVVLENVEPSLAASLTKSLTIPTIGIGSGDECGGQIAVSEDILGLTEASPKFIRRRLELGEQIASAFADYREEIKKNGNNN